ncbi:MAG: hypothetical protein R3C68_03915 [Myxococcota bacterium]
MRQEFGEVTPDLERVNAVLEDARRFRIELDGPVLGFALENTLKELMTRWCEKPDEVVLLQHLTTLINLSQTLPLKSTYGMHKTACIVCTKRYGRALAQRPMPGMQRRSFGVMPFGPGAGTVRPALNAWALTLLEHLLDQMTHPRIVKQSL